MTPPRSLGMWCYDRIKSSRAVTMSSGVWSHVCVCSVVNKPAPNCKPLLSIWLSLSLAYIDVSKSPTYIPKLPERHFYLWMTDKLLLLRGDACEGCLIQHSADITPLNLYSDVSPALFVLDPIHSPQ